jgi:hypothetical protein
MIWAKSLVKVLPMPLLIVFGQAMVKLWPVSPVHVVLLSVFVILFVSAAAYILDSYESIERKARYGKHLR